MALPYVPAGRIPASAQTTKQDDDALYWKRLQQLSVFQEPGAVTSVVFCPKKPYTIATTSSVRLSLYDTVVCEPLNMFSRFKQAVFGARFRKDGNLVAIGGEEGKLRVFDVASGTGTGKAPLRSVKASAQSLKVVDFSYSGKAVFSMADDGKLKQWDLANTGTAPIIEISAHTDSIRAGVVSSHSDNIVISGSYDHKVKLWDLRSIASSEPSIEIDVGAPVEDILFLPSENLLATASTNIIKIWDISAGGRQLASLQQHHKTVTSLALGSNGTYLLSGGIDRRINVFNLSNFTLTHSMSMASPVLGLSMSGDDSMMAVGMGSLLVIHKRAALKDVVAAIKFQDTKAMTKTAPKVEVKQRGEEKQTLEVSAQQKSQIKLDRIDGLLKNYKHGAAIKSMFTPFYLGTRKEQIVGYLKVIVHRRAIRAALSGQTRETLSKIIKFLYENLVRNNYFDILRHVAEALFEVYAEDEMDPQLVKQMVKLKESITRELIVQKQVSQTIGILEMILNNGKESTNDSVEDSAGVFGDVTVTSLPFDTSVSG